MKNYLIYTLLLTFVVVFSLVGLHYLPTITLYDQPLRKVDLLSDIRKPVIVPEDTFLIDNIMVIPEIKPLFIDTCRTGLTCIEDYSDSINWGMQPFYTALSDTMRKAPVRIAVFGDSFIEGDIFTSDLREMLQNHFGGNGVGYVTITSALSGYRPTVRHRFQGWKSHSNADTIRYEQNRLGISGHYYTPGEGAWSELGGVTYLAHLDTCNKASLFCLVDGECEITARINRDQTVVHRLEPSPYLQKITVEGNIGNVRWQVSQGDSALFYGMTMDGDEGIVLDNFSLRGSTGTKLRNLSKEILSDFHRLRPYDLIVLQYGLNVATERGYDYHYYKVGMNATIRHLKECFPGAGFLLVSVGDRNYRTESGDMATMPGVKNLIRFQQTIAAENNIAFWNMFEAMGGEGSIASMVHAKPSLANYDYTHINFRGGRHLAGLLYETLVYGKEQFDRRREYEME